MLYIPFSYRIYRSNNIIHIDIIVFLILLLLYLIICARCLHICVNFYVKENSTCYLACVFHCAKSLAYELWARFACDFARLFGCKASLSSFRCELLRVILLQGELSPERAAHLAHALCDSLNLCLSLSYSLPSLPLVLYFVGLTRAKSMRAQRTMLSTNCYSDACVRSAKTTPRLCFHFSLNNNDNNSRNWKTKKLPSSEKRQIIITNTSTTRLCVSETRKSNTDETERNKTLKTTNWLGIGRI